MKRIIPTLILLLSSMYALADVDTLIGVNAPPSKDYRQLTTNIVSGLSSDREKANAIYNWMTHHIDYDYTKSKDPKRKKDEPADVLRDNKATTDGYATLYVAMCREAGLKAVSIEGYSKDFFFDNGDKNYTPNHSWSAVMIDGKWELVDVLMGTGGMDYYDGWLRRMLSNLFSKDKLHYGNKERFVFHYSPAYFMQAPLVFRYKHAPADPRWQLTYAEMPLAVYEAGDSAIYSYNNTNYTLLQDNPALLHIAELDENEKIMEYADKAHQYNERYVSILGIKKQLEVGQELHAANNNADTKTIAGAIEKLQKGLDNLNEQKKSIAPHYAELTRKNAAKNREAKEYFRTLRSDNKVLEAACKRYKETTKKNIDKLNEKENTAKKRQDDLSVNNLNYIITNNIEKKPGSPELQKLVDSVNSRTSRKALVDKTIDEQTALLEAAMNDNQKRLYSLSSDLKSADSFLANETRYRIMLYDNYDDPVKYYSSLLKQMKFNTADSEHKYYLVTYDTINDRQERLMKTYIVLLDIYKNNIKDMEQYRKNNSTDNTITGNYESTVTGYVFALQKYLELISSFRDYESANGKVFGEMSKLYKDQEDIFEKMEDAEEARNKRESKDIADNRLFDEGENDNQQKVLKNNISKLEEALHG